MKVQKISVLLPVSEEILGQLATPSLLLALTRPRGPVKPRPFMGWCLAYTQLRLAVKDTLGQDILQLHQPHDGYGVANCSGCDGGGDEEATWPCRTIDVLAEHYNLGPLL